MSHTLEEWRPIAGLEKRYEVSNLGRVRSLPRLETHTRQGKPVTCYRSGKILKLLNHKKGYLMVNISVAGKPVMHTVHYLVATTFLPVCRGPYGVGNWVVDHINEDKTDNRVENLRWLTNKENISTPKARAKIRAKCSVQVRDATGRFT